MGAWRQDGLTNWLSRNMNFNFNFNFSSRSADRAVGVQNSSREGIELGRVLEMAVEGDWEEIARKELGCARKTLCVGWRGTETVINLLLGYG
jgi:hypothetical protein